MDILAEARRVFDIEGAALAKTSELLDHTFISIVKQIAECTGKVAVTGIGKSGHIARKIAATFSSLGTPSFYLHPAEAMHGDLGMLSANDIVIAISHSGESDEILRILSGIKLIGAALIGITSNANSTLAHASDIVQILPNFQEACYLGLAPTSSTTAVLCFGDALAIVASGIYGFQESDFGKVHPAGSLGKKLLLKVDDLMASGEEISMVHNGSPLKDAVIGLCKGSGIVLIMEKNDRLAGVITDGDLRRQLEKGVNVYQLYVQEVMTKSPVTIFSGKMAAEALGKFKEKKITHMPVLKDGKVVGVIGLQDILKAGIIDQDLQRWPCK